MTRLTLLGAVVLTSALLAAPAAAATITQLSSFAEFTSPYTDSNDFESAVIDTAIMDFESAAYIVSATAASGGVTTSGQYGLADNGDPLMVSFSQGVREVGLYFGNDDFNLDFDAILSVYDASSSLIGSVSVSANKNDYVDQFLGLRSSAAIWSASVSYSRPDAQDLAVYVDDFTVGAPEPASLALFGLGLGVSGLVVIRRRRRSRD